MASFWSHDSLSVIIPVLLVLPTLVLYAWCSGRRDKAAHGAYAALHSPSVRTARNAFDRRVAIAMREAKMGFQECVACGFTNALRVETCVLCGGEEMRNPRGVFASRWWRCTRRKPKRMGVVSARQQRIRRRREWIRVADEQGVITWRRGIDSFTGNKSTGELQCYVLEATQSARHSMSKTYEVDEDTLQADVSPEAEETTVEIVTVDSAVMTPPLTPDSVANALETEFNQLRVRIIESSTANAAHIAFNPTTSSSDPTPSSVTLVDTIRSVNLDFPSKVAHFITSTAPIFGSQATDDSDASAPATRLSINRATLLTDSLSALATMTVAQARGSLRVEFLGEQGIDAGGVYREWFLLLNEVIVKPDAGLFVCVDENDQTFYLNPQSRTILGEHHLTHFLAAGRVLGRALLEGNVSGFHLAPPLLKIILGLPVGFHDVLSFDPEAYKNLRWLLENNGVEALGLDFTVTQVLPNGQTHEVELVPGGSNIDVTDANKRDYVDLKVKYLLFGSVQPQLFAFLKGLYEIIPAELLVLFDAVELDYVLSGSDEIDVEDWERNTVISANLAYFPAAELFWKVVRELTQDGRRRLLQFATGSTRVPPGGFSALTSNDGQLCLFQLRGVQPIETRGYLHSHACFNRLDLPLHRKLKHMREAVQAAIVGDNIGFTTD